jgi:hypothetical protein
MDTNGFVECARSQYVADTTTGGCFLFIPPVADYTGWFDPKGTSASFDYAGLANTALGDALGTVIDGTVDEVAQADGSAIVTVEIHAQNALAFAVRGFDFNGQLLFGTRVAEIQAGAPASVGACKLSVTFRNSAPGAPLPNVEELLFCRFNDLLFISFAGQASGNLSDGKPGRLEVTQVGLLKPFAHANPHSRVALDGFPAEHILIRAK